MKKTLIALVLSLLGTAALAQPAVVASPRWKPPVANLAALPASGNTIGDTRIALDTMVHYTWDGDSWETAASGGGAGTVTSIAIAVPSEWTVSGSPVTTAGTITIAEATQTANAVYAGPTTGAAAAPGFRALVSADIPNNAADTSGNAATATTATTAATANAGDSATAFFSSGTIEAARLPAVTTLASSCPDAQVLGGTAAGTGVECQADDTGTDDQTATEVSYTPTTGTDWADPDPASAGEGLDDLAARLTTEEAKADDDVPESGDFGAATDLDADGSVSADSVALGTDTTGNYVAGATASQGLALTGTEGGTLGLMTCVDGQIPKNVGGTSWACAADATGSGIGGSTGATDRAILIASGTGGSTAQASSIVISTTALMSSIGGTQVTGGATGVYPTSGAGFEVTYDTDARAGGIDSGSGAAVFQSYSRTSSAWRDVWFRGASLQFDAGGNAALGLTTSAITSYLPLLTTRSVEANTAGSGTPNALTATESWKVFTNEAATAKNYHTLDSAVAGLTNTWCVQDADGIRIVAATGDTIRVLDKVTAAGGYIESTTIGSCVTLITINATEHFAHPINGTWTDGTFTYDDTGNTTP